MVVVIPINHSKELEIMVQQILVEVEEQEEKVQLVVELVEQEVLV